MPYTNNYSNYVTRLDDGVIRPMTVRELLFRLNELMSIDSLSVIYRWGCRDTKREIWSISLAFSFRMT